MPVTAKPGPYATPSAILDLVNRYRSRGLSTPINAEVLARAGISESLIPRTLHALQWLDLIEKDGGPTQTLEGLRLAPETEYRDRMADWLKAAYRDVFAFVDPTKDDGARVRDAFRGYQPIGQQERMVSLFQGLCAQAGLMPPKQTKMASASTSSSSQVRVTATRIVNPRPKDPPRRSTGNTTNPPSVPPALMGLLSSLPPDGDGWTADRRDKFLAAFRTLLDYCVPVLSSDAADPDEEAA